MRLGILLKSWL